MFKGKVMIQPSDTGKSILVVLIFIVCVDHRKQRAAAVMQESNCESRTLLLTNADYRCVGCEERTNQFSLRNLLCPRFNLVRDRYMTSVRSD